jgi:LmbE family N-acetylglucosaminyl deacetylase
LTKGGATKQRHKFGYTVEEMGEVRRKEMDDVAGVLDLTGMTVLDLPDSGLKEMDPREIETVVAKEIERIRPHVVVTYPVHGISGFHDHLVCHAVVKRVFMDLKGKSGCLKRLAFITLTEDHASKATLFHLSGSKDEEIDCIYRVDEVDMENCRKALDCYVTFKETIDKTSIKSFIEPDTCFELFREEFSPPITDLFAFI